MSGYLTYIQYTAGNTKGATTQGDLFNNPFRLGDVGDVDADYTGAHVVETVAAGASAAYKPAWDAAVKGVFHVVTDGGKQVELESLGIDANAFDPSAVTNYDVKIIANDDTVTYANLDTDGKVPTSAFPADAATKPFRVAYVYNNIVIPQNDLPMLKAEMKSIPLIAKARRIAVYFSQIAAFQAKTDYGLNLYVA